MTHDFILCKNNIIYISIGCECVMCVYIVWSENPVARTTVRWG